MSCPSTHTLSAPPWNDACVIASNVSAPIMAQFLGCCMILGAGPTEPDPSTTCYQYCNVTNMNVKSCFAQSLQGFNPPVSIDVVDVNCFSDKPPGTAFSNSTATTPNPKTSTSQSATASPSISNSTATSATGPAPASTSAKAQAPAGGSISIGAMVVAGLIVFGRLVQL